MRTICEIVFAAAPTARSDDAAAGRHWAKLPGLLALDLYLPAAAHDHDPHVRDGRSPVCLAQLAFSSLAELEQAAALPAFHAGLSCLQNALSCTALRCEAFAVAGEQLPGPLTARFSYVVRYFRPAENEASFVRNYIAGHVPLLGRLPQIRNVLCYFPLPWRHASGLAVGDYLLGNEVVFDDAEAFGAAMRSAVRGELRVHYRALPRFARDTHYAMERRRLFEATAG